MKFRKLSLLFESTHHLSVPLWKRVHEALLNHFLLQIAKRESENFAEMQAPNRRIHDDLARVARERDDAIRQLQHLKRQLNEKNQNDAAAFEDQLDRSRQVAMTQALYLNMSLCFNWDRSWESVDVLVMLADSLLVTGISIFRTFPALALIMFPHKIFWY